MIDYKDRKPEITYAHCALRMAGLNIGYEEAEFIVNLLKEVEEKKGEFDLLDYSKIRDKHLRVWENYKANKKEKQDGT